MVVIKPSKYGPRIYFELCTHSQINYRCNEELRPKMSNKEPCPLKIDPYRGVLITTPILNSTAKKYIIRMDFYILDIIDQKICNFITSKCRKR